MLVVRGAGGERKGRRNPAPREKQIAASSADSHPYKQRPSSLGNPKESRCGDHRARTLLMRIVTNVRDHRARRGDRINVRQTSGVALKDPERDMESPRSRRMRGVKIILISLVEEAPDITSPTPSKAGAFREHQ